jgi:hypothetical protein
LGDWWEAEALCSVDPKWSSHGAGDQVKRKVEFLEIWVGGGRWWWAV